MKENARRDFLKKSLIGISGAALLPSTLVASVKTTGISRTSDELVYRVLGKTGLKIPVISMGTGDTNNPKLVKAAHDAGIKMFFTATYYGEGNNEKMLGEALKGLPRDSFMVGTAAIPKGIDHQGGVYTKDSTYDQLMKTAEGSLQRFGLDYVDILLLPYAAKRESVFFEPLLKAMQDLKKQGKARFIGIATHSYMDEALKAAADTNVYDVAMPAYNFRSASQQNIQDAVAYAANAGIGIMAMKSQAGAYWDKERKQPINSRSTLRWVLNNEHVSTVVSGMGKVEELEQNIALMKDMKFTEEDRKELKLAQADAPSGLYCKQCGNCIAQCPYGLDVPTIMRSYMYAYGYRNLEHARHALDYASLPDLPCGHCESCSVNCSSGFDIPGKVKDIARLKEVPREFLTA